MELNAEINKIFGTEMAKLFVETIDENEMKEKANEVWNKLIKRIDSYGWKKDESDLERYIKEIILSKLYEKIENIIKQPINEDILENKAKELVEKARIAGEEAIVKAMANRMVENTLSAYNYNDKIVDDVLKELAIRKNEQLRY